MCVRVCVENEGNVKSVLYIRIDTIFERILHIVCDHSRSPFQFGGRYPYKNNTFFPLSTTHKKKWHFY